jgi:long-chain acyl-CoA synthetase
MPATRLCYHINDGKIDIDDAAFRRRATIGPPMNSADAAALRTHTLSVLLAEHPFAADDPLVTGLPPLRMVRSITAPLSPAVARKFHERFGIVVLNSYGQTELGGEVVGWTAADTREFGDRKLGAVGRPY